MDFPELILPKEWDEIAELQDLRRLWNLPARVSGAALAAYAFGARFFIDIRERDAYTGAVFVIQRIALDDPPVMLLRDEGGKLRVVHHLPGATLFKRPWGLTGA